MNQVTGMIFTDADADNETTARNNKIYSLKSNKLTYKNNNVLYSRVPNQPIKLTDYFIPKSAVSPKLKRLSDDVDHTNTALAICDLTIRKSRNNYPPRKSLQKAVTNYWNTLLFLRARGIYRLKDAKKGHLHELCKAFSKGGWTAALAVDQIVASVIEDLTEESLIEAVRFYSRSNKKIDALNGSFWRQRIGFKSANLFNLENKNAFEIKARHFGFSFTERCLERFTAQHSTTDNSLRNLISSLNNLYYLPNSVDKFGFLPYENAKYSSKKYANTLGDRTGNLDIEDASHMLGRSIDWIYDHGPKLVSILESCRYAFSEGTIRFRENFLHSNNPLTKLAEDLGIKVPNVWTLSMNPSRRRDYYQSVDELIGALQGACAVAIAGFNARRSSEVCDDEIGLRETDLLDAESEFPMVNFYIEKSFQSRHWFYVNRTTSDAINLLIRLKKACENLDPALAKLTGHPSLFKCHSWTSRGGPGSSKPISFTFSRARGQQRSLTSFLSFLEENFQDVDVKSHMWRRFFALIYIYRYDHSDLQSLSQHLRHMEINQTFVYVTDTSARAHSEEISFKVPKIKQEKVADIKLLNTLYEDHQELSEIIHLVKTEKLGKTIESILSAGEFAGGFPRLIRKLYKVLSKEMNFSVLKETEKANLITSTVLARGYTCDPMPHGQCSAPNNGHNYSAKCSNNGRLEKEHASATFCRGCMFHCTNSNFMENLKTEISDLDADIASDLTPQSIRENALQAKSLLIEIIETYNTAARKNSSLMNEILEQNAKK